MLFIFRKPVAKDLRDELNLELLSTVLFQLFSKIYFSLHNMNYDFVLFYFTIIPDPEHRGRDNNFHFRHVLFLVWYILFRFAYSLLVTFTVFRLVLGSIHR